MIDSSVETSSDPVTSSPIRKIPLETQDGERLTEADKQILQWAGKLEMESVDLREKSASLITLLQSNSNKLCGLLQDFNGLLKQQQLQPASLKKITCLIESLGNQLTLQQQNVKKVPDLSPIKKEDPIDLEKFSSKIIRSFEVRQTKTTKIFEGTQDMIFNMARQLEDMHSVMASMSNNINALNCKQNNIEQQFSDYMSLHQTNTNDNSNLTETTLLNESHDDFDNGIIDDIGPNTRSKKRSYKRRKTSINKIDKKPVNRRNATIARTIIPWEELNEYSSEL